MVLARCVALSRETRPRAADDPSQVPQASPKTNADPGSGIGVGESEREETAVRSIGVLSFGVVLGAARES